ncbi:MAG: hypothetical protein R3F43_13485 [bacterium]
MSFLADSAAFRHECLAWGVPGYGGAAPTTELERLLFLQALQQWVAGHLEVRTTECEAEELDIEEMLPALGLTVRVKTAGGVVRDRFAFVNFKDNHAVTAEERAVASCGFRKGLGLPPADAPKCGADGLISDGRMRPSVRSAAPCPAASHSTSPRIIQ